MGVSLQAWAPTMAGLTRSGQGRTAVLWVDFSRYPWNGSHITPGHHRERARGLVRESRAYGGWPDGAHGQPCSPRPPLGPSRSVIKNQAHPCRLSVVCPRELYYNDCEAVCTQLRPPGLT